MSKSKTRNRSNLNKKPYLTKIVGITLVLFACLIGTLYLVGLNVKKADINLIGSGIGTKSSAGLATKTTLKEAVTLRAANTTTVSNTSSNLKEVDEVATQKAAEKGELAIQNENLVAKDGTNIVQHKGSLDEVRKSVETDSKDTFMDVVVAGGQAIVDGLFGAGITTQQGQQAAVGAAIDGVVGSGFDHCIGPKCVDEVATQKAAEKGELAIQNKNLVAQDGTNIAQSKGSLDEVRKSSGETQKSNSGAGSAAQNNKDPEVCKAGNVVVAEGTWVPTGAASDDDGQCSAGDVCNARQCVEILDGCRHGRVAACHIKYAETPAKVVLPVSAGTEYAQGLKPNDPNVDKGQKVKANCYNGVEVVPSDNLREGKGVCDNGEWKDPNAYNKQLFDQLEKQQALGRNCVERKYSIGGNELWVTCSGGGTNKDVTTCLGGKFDENGICQNSSTTGNSTTDRNPRGYCYVDDQCGDNGYCERDGAFWKWKCAPQVNHASH